MRLTSRVRVTIVCIAVLAALAFPGAFTAVEAQAVPPGLTPTQIEALRRNPEQIRQQIQQSGLSPEQIRARLRAAGYPESLLDAYLTSGQTGLAAPEPDMASLAALEALGMPFAVAQALLPPDTGMVEHRLAPSRVFGVDVFRRSTTQFLPLLAGPVPPDYRLGPGDILLLILTGDVELTHTLSVSRDGFVLIPQVGQVPVTNLTLDQFREVLFTRLGPVYSGVRRGANATTRFGVSVANVRTTQVYVVGEVIQPGAYQLSALGTALTALYAAGGVTEEGSVRRIEIRRNGALLDSLDLYDYLLRGDARGDIRLETGDVIFVPVRGPRVDLSGAVVRPAIYETRAGETAADVIAAAGGLAPNADLTGMIIFRHLSAGERGPGHVARAALRVAFGIGGGDDPASDDHPLIPDVEMRDGDSAVVHEAPNISQGLSVWITGVVNRAGRFPWRPGMTLRDLMLLAGGPAIGADLRAAWVARMPLVREGGALADTLQVPMDSSYILDRQRDGSYAGPPGPSFAPAGAAPEFLLEPFDEVLVVRQPRFQLFQRYVTIFGEVMVPGAYPLTHKDTRMSDLVARAGGLLPDAYAEGARFYRLFEYSGLGDTAQRTVTTDTTIPMVRLRNRDQVNVSLAQALARPRSAADVTLQPGDSLFVPQYIPTVRVSGAVVAPTSVQYVAGKDAMYYLENAGGFSANADAGRTVVRQANGSARTRSKFLFWSSWPQPGPGAEVFVPAATPKPSSNWLPTFAAIASVLASTATVILALQQ
jgi:protein involved in polysaccharide export with SLBB domain